MIKIRNSKKNDMLTIYELICSLEDTLLDINTFKIIFLNNMSNNNIIYKIAQNKDDEIVGFISCHIQQLLHHQKNVAEIQELIVKKEYRNKSIGKNLIKAIEKEITSKNCESLEVTAQNKRLSTHKFYLNYGFKKSHFKFVKNIQ